LEDELKTIENVPFRGRKTIQHPDGAALVIDTAPLTTYALLRSAISYWDALRAKTPHTMEQNRIMLKALDEIEAAEKGDGPVLMEDARWALVEPAVQEYILAGYGLHAPLIYDRLKEIVKESNGAKPH